MTRDTVPAALDGERIDRAVALLTGLPRSVVADLVSRGAVRVAGRQVAARSRRVAEGDVVEVDLPEDAPVASCPPDASVVVPLVHEDAEVLVIDKPADLVVHPGAGHSSGTLIQGVVARFPEVAGVGDPDRPGVVHRLDRGTSGLLVIARSARAHASLTRQMADRTAARDYLALVWGHPEAGAGMIDAPVGRAERDRTRMAVSRRGRQARTGFEVTARFTRPAEVALVECKLETGRTHQIRVHLAAIGHPVVGDQRYGGARPALPLDRQFLHAFRIAFDHPARGERMEFTSPLPADLDRVRATLG